MAKSFNPSKYTQAVQGGPTVLTHSSAVSPYWGITNCTSPTVVISTTAVKSDSLIFFSLRNPSAVGVSNYYVGSISQGGFFTIVGSWTTAGSASLFWELKNQR